MKNGIKNGINELIDKARRSLKAAKQMCKSGDYDFAVSRAYYAIFYFSEALLLKKGKTYNKHTAVISGIFESYVKIKELPKEFHKTLHRAFDLRQEGDYLTSNNIIEEIALELISDIEKQIDLAIHSLQA